MTQRSPLVVVLLSIVTFGIYSIYWFVKTKGELNTKGANIPTAWLLIVPFVSVYWMYKYFEGAEQVSGGKISTILYFLLGFLVTPLIPQAMAQSEYNKMGANPVGVPMNGTPLPQNPVVMPQTPAPIPPSDPTTPMPAAPMQEPMNAPQPAQPVPTEPTMGQDQDNTPPTV